MHLQMTFSLPSSMAIVAFNYMQALSERHAS